MTERLSALDASFLYLETANAPLHTGSVVLFQESPGALDHQRVVKLIQERIAFLPRYRQRLREVPGGLAHPVWVDDAHFDATYHVRRSALPAPGSIEAARCGRCTWWKACRAADSRCLPRLIRPW